jgi:hypothetical protein
MAKDLLDRTRVETTQAENKAAILLAGGGFRHQGHVAFDRRDNKPLSNLFVRMMQQMGIGSG